MIFLKEIYQKIRDGDPLSDDEIRGGLAQFRLAESIISQLGDTFRLATSDLRSRISILEGFKEARKNHFRAPRS